jgi:hypothetical protein
LKFKAIVDYICWIQLGKIVYYNWELLLAQCLDYLAAFGSLGDFKKAASQHIWIIYTLLVHWWIIQSDL